VTLGLVHDPLGPALGADEVEQLCVGAAHWWDPSSDESELFELAVAEVD
jgi:hypothetical protein